MIQVQLLKSPLTQVFARTLTTTLVTTLSLTLLASQSPAQSVVPAAPTTQPTLVMGTETDYIPFEYRDPELGANEIVGFDIEVAKYIAHKLGFDLQLQGMKFEDLIPALRARHLDFAMSAITPTSERRQVIDFSEIYFESSNTIVAPKGHNLKRLSDLQGKTVGVLSGTIQERQLLQLAPTLPRLKIQSFKRTTEIIDAVREGQVDAAIIEDTVVQAYLENNPTLEFQVITEQAPTGVAIAFPKGSKYVKAFNQVLREMKANGELRRLVRQWFENQ
ncbi:transporter substrate-binding domain-containing protein [Neosynechococcus sphagnicola]|uniref:transporter substrate-binding domain-containing protein n=1 Tax=Neosynechococcus sphagnicola TaxID=1501145 RepID=UPI00068ECC76|nr:transporter substrate-binding domain-containing protein [Neosynechococcus sphagnicola]